MTGATCIGTALWGVRIGEVWVSSDPSNASSIFRSFLEHSASLKSKQSRCHPEHRMCVCDPLTMRMIRRAHRS